MPGVISWCLQRTVSIVLVLFILLNILALTVSVPEDASADSVQSGSGHRRWMGSAWNLQWFHAAMRSIFVWYGLLLHVSVTIFPWRACYAIRDVTSRIKKVIPRTSRGRNRTLSTNKAEVPLLSRSSSSSSSEILSRVPTPLTEYDPDSELDDDHVIHAILIPNYKEDLDCLRETLDVLASHVNARCSYDIYLAMEDDEAGSEGKAMCLMREFTKHFRSVDFTLHPKGIPGEAQGKSSNLKWAAGTVSERYQQSTYRKNVIVTVMDSDSQLSTSYFTNIDRMHLSYPSTAATTVYVPPIIFDRNCQSVSKIVRVADLAWCCAGLSGLYVSSRIRPPTSVYSIPLTLVDYVGGWDAGPEAIGEDLHMYLKCFFALRGNLTTQTVPAPVSQTDVHGDEKGLRALVSDFKARYKQGLRHMWGALDTGFAVQELWKMMTTSNGEHKCTDDFGSHSSHRRYGSSASSETDVEVPLDRPLLSKSHSSLHKPRLSPLANTSTPIPSKPHYVNIIVCLHRLFEAHFLPAHVFVFIVSTGIYDALTPQSLQPAEYIWLSNITGYLRAAGLISMMCVFFCYETFHKVSIQNREIEMQNAGLYDGMVASGNSFGHRSLKENTVDYFLFTISGFLFGSLPAIHAQLSHLWSLELAYGVSKKPKRVRAGYNGMV